MNLLSVLTVLLFASSVLADEQLMRTSLYRQAMAAFRSVESSLNAQQIHPNLMNVPADQAQACQWRFERTLQNGKMEIHIFGGYIDVDRRGITTDLYERTAFVEKLTTRCPDQRPLLKSCGFQRAEDDADLIYKEIEGPEGKMIRVEIQLKYSSLTTNDVVNRRSPEQVTRSEEVRNAFGLSLKQADVVFYSGHSRGGGGPSFEPPRLRGGHVDYGWYEKNRPGLQFMLEALRGRTEPPMTLLGMFSWDSRRHFLSSLTGLPIRSTVLTRALITDREAQLAMMSSLNGVLNLSCRDHYGVRQGAIQVVPLQTPPAAL